MNNQRTSVTAYCPNAEALIIPTSPAGKLHGLKPNTNNLAPPPPTDCAAKGSPRPASTRFEAGSTNTRARGQNASSAFLAPFLGKWAFGGIFVAVRTQRLPAYAIARQSSLRRRGRSRGHRLMHDWKRRGEPARLDRPLGSLDVVMHREQFLQLGVFNYLGDVWS